MKISVNFKKSLVEDKFYLITNRYIKQFINLFIECFVLYQGSKITTAVYEFSEIQILSSISWYYRFFIVSVYQISTLTIWYLRPCQMLNCISLKVPKVLYFWIFILVVKTKKIIKRSHMFLLTPLIDPVDPSDPTATKNC